MAGAEKIVEKIMHDAGAEAEEVRRQAREEAEQVVEKATREAEQEKEQLLKEGRARADERHRQLVTSAHMDGRRQVLGAKEELINEVLEEAQRELARLPRERYARVLRDLLLAAAGEEEQELILSPRDREDLGPELLEQVRTQRQEQGRPVRLALAEETRPLEGGFVLRQGGVELNYSFFALLRSRQEELEAEVARILFAPAAAEAGDGAEASSSSGPEAGESP